jgi:hypothetical protein
MMQAAELVSISEDPGKHVRTRLTQEQGGMEGRLMVRKIALVGRAFLQCAPEKVFVFRHSSRNDFLNIAYVPFGVT